MECDRFEQDWRDGHGPRIEDYLAKALEPDRLALLNELVGLELELRRARGDDPQLQEYLARFPGYVGAVRAAFGEAPAATGAEPGAGAAHELLFGILALQNNFVGRDDLLTAFNAWVSDKSRPIGRLLLDRGALDSGRHALLEALVCEHLKRNGGDAERSLGTLSFDPAWRDLERVADPNVQASLALVGVDRAATVTSEFSATNPIVLPSPSPRFKILRPHARGGLGEVFVARDRELNREVALKQIQAGFADVAGHRARFLLEAEITGSLEHPGIVPVYGLGTYADGRPYYAMRFIRGDSLKDAVVAFHREFRVPGRDPGARALAFRRLLQRFIDVCDAVAYAHSRGVLHRDLKPGNVMLGRFGETLLVDWGLAKPLGARELQTDTSEATLRPSSASASTPTELGSALGTPAYMSPEQAAGRHNELGPASDVYGLGATLYFLLAGRPPFEGTDLAKVLEAVRRGDCPRPRQVDDLIPAALEAVCLKAMALQPGDRYPSPLALSEDVEHWLADEPVSVWREPLATRARRWARRHRPTVAAAAAAALAGVLGLAAVAVVQVRANRRLTKANDMTNRALAETTNAKKATEYALERSEESRRLAQAVLTFLEEDVLAAARPEGQEGGLGRNVSVRQAIDAAETKIAERFKRQPAVEAEVRYTLGQTYNYLGAPLLAVRQHERALELRQTALGPDDDATLRSRLSLAGTYQDTGNTAEAIALHEATRKLVESKFGRDHTRTLASRNDLAEAYRAAGRFADAAKLHELTLKLIEAKLGPDHPDTLTSRNNLAAAYHDAGQIAESIRLHEGTVKRFESRFGPDHPNTLVACSNLAVSYQDGGRFAEAIALQKQILQARESKLGPDHPSTLISRTSLGAACRATGRYAEAIKLLEPTLKAFEAQLSADHVFTSSCRNQLLGSYESLDRWSDAEPIRRATLARHRATEKPDSLVLAGDLDELGLNLLRQCKWSESEVLIRQSLVIRQSASPDDWRRFNAMSQLGGALLGQGRFAEAEPLVVEGYLGMKARAGTISPRYRFPLPQAADQVLRLYERWGEPAQVVLWKAKLGLAALPADVFARP